MLRLYLLQLAVIWSPLAHYQIAGRNSLLERWFWLKKRSVCNFRWSFFGNIWQRCRISTLHWDLEEHMVSTTAKQITPWTKSSEKEWEKEDESFKSVCKLCIIRACNAPRSHKFRGFNRKAYSWHLTFVKLITIPGVKMKGGKQWINNWEHKNFSSFPFALFQLFTTVSRPILDSHQLWS